MDASSLVTVAGEGARLVLWLLIALSMVQVAIMIERAVVFARSRSHRGDLEALIERSASAGDLGWLATALAPMRSPVARILRAGAARVADGPEAAAEIMQSRILAERQELEKRLSFLGTLGNNAPFIGLFGTVLGIIRAFGDLATAGAGGSKVVMAGISEALVATAVGLLVALPAVAAFNVFQRLIRTRLADAESLRSALLSHLKRRAA